jgi:hypothetical protein
VAVAEDDVLDIPGVSMQLAMSRLAMLLLLNVSSDTLHEKMAESYSHGDLISWASAILASGGVGVSRSGIVRDSRPALPFHREGWAVPLPLPRRGMAPSFDKANIAVALRVLSALTQYRWRSRVPLPTVQRLGQMAGRGIVGGQDRPRSGQQFELPVGQATTGIRLCRDPSGRSCPPRSLRSASGHIIKMLPP